MFKFSLFRKRANQEPKREVLIWAGDGYYMHPEYMYVPVGCSIECIDRAVKSEFIDLNWLVCWAIVDEQGELFEKRYKSHGVSYDYYKPRPCKFP